MARTPVIGIMGPGIGATSADLQNAEALGRLIAGRGWITLTGGRASGVMEAALRGAKQAGGQTFAILPSKAKSDASRWADIVIPTGFGSGRNIINVLASDVVVGCGIGAGTASEIALALKEKRPTVLITANVSGNAFFRGMAPDLVTVATTPDDAFAAIARLLSGPSE